MLPRGGEQCGDRTALVFEHGSKLINIEENGASGCWCASVVLPEAARALGPKSFSCCLRLESLQFADYSCLQERGASAFANCHSLGKVFVPGTVATIGDSGFECCVRLRE
ncbi:MAG: leucine-rich repeat domain-containing protein [Holosporaceae bacterium]|nr:leucine-rich repeat domain-containing protein [Holosporaceae bacterium]